MINVLDRLSLPGGTKNEDYIANNDKTVIMLDGSTGLDVNAPDASWFVQEFSKRFLDLIAVTDELCFSVNQAIKELYSQYLLIADADYTIFPSASVVIAHIRDDKLQILNIGDCTTLLFGKKFTTIYSHEVDCFDSLVINEMVKTRERTGADISEIVNSKPIKEMLLSNRQKMNVPNGYEILSFNMREYSEADILEYQINDIDRIIMFTDGFRLMSNELSSVCCPRLSDLYERLRLKEKEDALLNMYPRFKVSDDASAVIWEITKE